VKTQAHQTRGPHNLIGGLVSAPNPICPAAIGEPGVPGYIIMLAFITIHKCLAPLRALSKTRLIEAVQPGKRSIHLHQLPAVTFSG